MTFHKHTADQQDFFPYGKSTRNLTMAASPGKGISAPALKSYVKNYWPEKTAEVTIAALFQANRRTMAGRNERP